MATAGRFVGRSAELAGLAEALDRAMAGRTTAVLVAGEPGIGKTRLLEELEHLAGERAVPVLWGRATTEEGAPPYWPWRQVLRRWIAGTDPEAVRDAVGAVSADVAPQLRRIAPELVPVPTAPEHLSPGSDDPEERFALFEATSQLLQRLAQAAGLVVVVDDLQWADAASLRLLTHVVRDVRDARLLVAGALRPVETALTPAVADAVAAVGAEPATTRFDLPGLAPDDVGRQLEPVLGTRPDAATVAAVAARTGGNPLFVQEVGRLLATGEHGVPDAVRSAIGRRLALLRPATLDVLQAAAVVGVDISPALVGDVAGVAVDEVVDHLDEALAADLLTEARDAVGYRFAHDLVRETCRLDLSAAARARLHLRAADALDRLGDRTAEVAHHRHAALPLGDPAAARDAAVGAAEQAMAQLAYEEAARCYEWAVAAATAAGTDPSGRARLHALAARAHHHGHDGAAAMAAAEAAVQLAQRSGDAAAIAQAVLALEDTSEPEWLAKVATWCDQALELLADGDDDAGRDGNAGDTTRARLLAQRAVASILHGQEQLPGASAAALAAAERCGDVPALATALRARQLATSSPDGAPERLRLGARMLDLGKGAADARLTSWGHLWRFDALVQLGRLDEAEDELRRLEPVVDAGRQPLFRWHLVRSRAAVHAARGRFDAALQADRTARALAERGGYPGALVASSALRSQLSTLTGRRLVEPEELRLDGAPPVFASIARSVLAELHLAFGEHDDAARLYDEILAAPDPRLPFLRITFDTTMAHLAAGLGDRATAEACYEALLPHADLHVTGGAGAILTRGSVEHHLGVAAVGAGRLDPAVDHLRAAVASNTAAGMAPGVAEAQCALAETLLRRAAPGDRDAARDAAVDARRLADELGMRLVHERAAAVLDRVGAPAPDSPLTRREHEVADLVAEGMTNRQIAVALHIAERTAENHVQHILTKLGFNTRSQIAAWVTSRASRPSRASRSSA